MAQGDRGKEVWLYDMLTSMEEAGHLAEFCRHIGIESPLAEDAGAELAWLDVKRHFTDEDGTLHVEDACRAVLQFPPMMSVLAESLRRSGET